MDLYHAVGHFSFLFFQDAVAALLPLLVAGSTAATSAATAALGGTEERRRGYDTVPGSHGVHPIWQEFPAAQNRRQNLGLVGLEQVHGDDKDCDRHDWHPHAHQHLPAGQRQAEDAQWQEQEAQDEVEGGKPAVFGGTIAEGFGQADGEAHEWNGIP